MSATNTVTRTIFGTTHEGGRAAPEKGPLAIPDKQQLMRLVSSCLLFENTYYESGSEIADNIRALCAVMEPQDIADIARVARTDLRLRHVPLFLAVQLAKRKAGRLAAETIDAVIQRADEMAEIVAIYFRENAREPLTKGHTKLPAAMKRGLARAFPRFNAYALAKWDQPKGIRLRDVLFLCHAKPKDEEQAALWKQLVDGTLPPADTWEVALSSGADKKASWERLLAEKKLGYMATLFNLRNMAEAGVDQKAVEARLLEGALYSKALPFRYLTAARQAPQFADALNAAMLLQKHGSLGGRTAMVIDVSGSMDAPVSAKSKTMRLDAAAALTIYFREVAESVRVFTFSDRLVEVMNVRGLPLADAISASQNHGGTRLAEALTALKPVIGEADRLIVVTDEQSHDGIVSAFAPRSYLINVGPYRPGLDTSQGWTRVNGWSDRIVDWISYEETGAIVGED